MYTIAIVDDEDWVLEILSKYIREYEPDFAVTQTFTDSEAACLAIQKAPVQALITDIRMFGCTGLELAQRIRASSMKTEIVVISAYRDFDYAREAMQYGILDYLLKPIDFSELSACLEKIRKRLQKSENQINLLSETVNLFLYYVLAGIFPDADAISLAAKSIRLPFDPAASPVALLAVPASLAENIERDNGRQMLLHWIRDFTQAQWVYDMISENGKYLFLAMGMQDHLELPSSVEQLSAAKNLYAFLENPEGRRYRSILRQQDRIEHTDPVGELVAPRKNRSAAEQLSNDAKAFIERHYGLDLSREDIAEALFVSSAHLSRMFKLTEGMSVMDYLTQFRMKKAIELLRSTHRMTEICMQLGYRTYNTFLSHFRQYAGMSPKEYQRLILKMEVPDEDSR